MSNVFIKPSVIEIEGEQVVALVRDPETGIPLDANGEWKPMSQFWARRLRDRDVVAADADAGTERKADTSPAAPVPFAVCANCVTPEACANSTRCVKAPLV
jgi:hypothetical protein